MSNSPRIPGILQACLFIGVLASLALHPVLADTWSSGTNLTYINSISVNVGIGTNLPSAPFTIRGDFGTATQGEKNWIYMEQSSRGPAFSLGYRVEGTIPSRVFLGTGNSKPLDFRTSSAPQAMTILNAGKVGINSPAPTAKFEVVSGNGDGIKAKASGSESSANFFLEPASAHSNKRNRVISAYGDQHGDLSIRNSNTASGNPYGATGTTRLLINREGNIGIKTANPDADLKLRENVESYTFKIGGQKPGGGGLTFQNQVAPGTAISSSNPATGGFILYQDQDEAKGYVRCMDVGTRDYADPWNGGSQIRFLTSGMAPSGTNGTQNSLERMVIDRLGKVGIGTSSPQSLLHVRGSAKVEGVLEVESVVTRTWTVAPDYVFEKDYKLASLDEVDTFVKKNKHLPEAPSAKDFKEKGMDLAEMNFVLLKQVEELTLHAIRQEKRTRISRMS